MKNATPEETQTFRGADDWSCRVDVCAGLILDQLGVEVPEVELGDTLLEGFRREAEPIIGADGDEGRHGAGSCLVLLRGEGGFVGPLLTRGVLVKAARLENAREREDGGVLRKSAPDLEGG